MSTPSILQSPQPPQSDHTAPVPKSLVAWLLAALAGALVLVRPFAGTLFFAMVLAVSLYPLHKRLTARFGGRERLSAGVMTFVIFAFVWVPLLGLSTIAASELSEGVEHLKQVSGIERLEDMTPDNIKSTVEPLLERISKAAHVSPQDIAKHASGALDQVRAALPQALSASASALGRLFLALASLFFLLADGRRLLGVVARLMPLDDHQSQHLWKCVSGVARSSLLGAGASALFSAMVVTGAFALAGMPRPFLFGILALFAAFIPVAGSGLVWMPGALYLALTGRVIAGLGVAAGCVAGTLVSGHIVKPWVVRGQSGLHIAILLFAILGGVAMFGLVGLFAGPVLAATAQGFIEIYLEAKAGSPITRAT